MIFEWFKIFNLDEFEALDLVSKMYTQIIEGIGQKEILVTKGDCVSMLYEGVFLPIQLNDINPFIKDGEGETEPNYAVYIDSENNVYLGIEADEN